jgi:hypothetical protein
MSKEDIHYLPNFDITIDSFGYILKKIDACILRLEKHCSTSSSNKLEVCIELQELKHKLINNNTEETKWIIR